MAEKIKFEDEGLIDLVRQNDVLYNKSNPKYANNKHKGMIWVNLAKQLGTNEKTARDPLLDSWTSFRLTSRGMPAFKFNKHCIPLSRMFLSREQQTVALLSCQNTLLAAYLYKNKKKKKIRRRFWVHPIFSARQIHGEYHHLMEYLQSDERKFLQYLRMDKKQFRKLYGMLKGSLTKESARAISPEQRLVVTLRFLATGASYHALSFSFRIGLSTISEIVRETCAVIYTILQPNYLRTPNTPESWNSISHNFWTKWQVPNCLGAIDGKHCNLKKPPLSGSLYFNYKGSFSLVLLAVADAQYKFLFIDFGSYGHESDAGIFDRSRLRKAIDEKTLGIPEPSPLPGCETKIMPYHFLGDAAFPLLTNLQKPFGDTGGELGKRIYNYRLSRGRRVVENAFGLMSSRWRILLKEIETSDIVADEIIKACCVLHNFLITEGKISAQMVDQNDQENARWRSVGAQMDSVATNIRKRGANRPTNEAIENRNVMIGYYLNEGQVDWQMDSVSDY